MSEWGKEGTLLSVSFLSSPPTSLSPPSPPPVCWADAESSFCWWLWTRPLRGAARVGKWEPHSDRVAVLFPCWILFLFSSSLVLCHKLQASYFPPVLCLSWINLIRALAFDNAGRFLDTEHSSGDRQKVWRSLPAIMELITGNTLTSVSIYILEHKPAFLLPWALPCVPGSELVTRGARQASVLQSSWEQRQ